MSTAPPFFTVVVPVYNHERYIGAALDSLLDQTDPDWEAVVVNDGSTDGTPALIEAYACRDARIRVIHQPNGGQPVALNTGVQAAAGQWICWLSSDDLFDPHKLATHRRWIERHPRHAYFFTRFRTLDDATGRIASSDQGAIPQREWQVLDLLSYNYINGITLCIRADAFREEGLFDATNRYGQDYDLHLRMLTRYEAIPIPEETCISRVHAAQFTRTENRSMFYDCASAAIRFLAKTPFDRLIPWLDPRDASAARQAADRALDIALSPDAYVNQLGPHPLLLARLLEWADARAGAQGVALRRNLEWRILQAARALADPRRAPFWRDAALWTALRPRSRMVHAYTPIEVADRSWMEWTRREDPEAEALRRFIERRQQRPPPTLDGVAPYAGDRLAGPGVSLDQCRIWAVEGWRVTRLDPDDDGLRVMPWGWNLGIRSARVGLPIALAAVPAWDRTNPAAWPVGVGGRDRSWWRAGYRLVWQARRRRRE